MKIMLIESCEDCNERGRDGMGVSRCCITGEDVTAFLGYSCFPPKCPLQNFDPKKHTLYS